MTTPVPELVEELADRIAIIRDGQLTAFDTADGLRRLTGTDGSLAEVLQRILNPETLANIDYYFEHRINARRSADGRAISPLAKSS